MQHTPTGIAEVRVMNERGSFGAPTRVTWNAAGLTFGSEPEAADIDGRGFFLTPGLVDAHAHVAWHAFNEADRDRKPQDTQNAATLGVLEEMLRAGFTRVRDAGGLTPELVARSALSEPQRAGALPHALPHVLPDTQSSIDLITRAHADAHGGLLASTEAVLERGARWVKLVGTASVASPPGSGLDPVFTLEEQRAVARRAAEVGAGVMLHAWGGQAIDDAIEAGVMSIEHGIFLTPAQAKRAAEHGMTLVPTLKIYRLVQAMIEAGSLPQTFGPRVAEAVAAHPGAVRVARDAGLPIALGSDFSTPDQHGTNRTEFDELVRAGLTPEEALVAATHAGANLLARVDTSVVETIAQTDQTDAVLFRSDPREPGAFSAQGSVAAVIHNGTFIDLTTDVSSHVT